ncbi:MAG: efflux RND transporter periplasmic adaptor subunit [Magnetovibrio sp.]|nr:efflux RND transporter periplasmic adaptor subunit [Magnetovibrio sp.]
MTVRAQVLGHVVDVVASKGDVVKAGDVILHIDPEDRKGLLAESVARMKQRKIAYEAARKLRKGGYSSRLSVATAKADLAAVRAQVVRMKRNLDNTTVKAPMAGILNSLPIKAGDYFDKKGAIVGRIVDLSVMVALGQVAERDISGIALGKTSTVRLPNGREYSGEVTFVGSASHALTRTFPVEVSLNIIDGSVREGITAEIKLPMKTVFAHRISPALLTLDGDGKVGVKTVDENNIIQFHRVQVVADAQDGMWLAGLPAKIRIISVGQEFVRVGQKVDVIEGTLDTMIPAPKSGG